MALRGLEQSAERRRQPNPWEDIRDPKEFMNFLNKYSEDLFKESPFKGHRKEIVLRVMPHMIMAHGFFCWQSIAVADGIIPNPNQYKKSRIERDEIEKSNFGKFSQELFGKSAFSILNPKEKTQLSEEGWQQYLED
jgi:hypothetical protein